MKLSILLTVAALAIGQSSFAAQGLNGKTLPEQHDSCLQAWENVFAGDMTAREAATNAGVIAGVTVGSFAASKALNASGTSAKVLVALGAIVAGVTIVNMSQEEQMETIATISKEGLLESGAALETIASSLSEAGENVSVERVAEAVNSITDVAVRSLCTTDNNPIVLGRYLELVIGKIKRTPGQ